MEDEIENVKDGDDDLLNVLKGLVVKAAVVV